MPVLAGSANTGQPSAHFQPGMDTVSSPGTQHLSRSRVLMFLYDPYAIGPYAEGEYEVLLPLSAFQGAINPAYAPDFTGSPSPEVKPKP